MKRRPRLTLAAIVLAVSASAGFAPTLVDTLNPRDIAVPAAQSTRSESVRDLIAQVRTVTTIPDIVGYERDCKRGKGCVFGPAWNDPNNHSGCDTRNTVLAAQLQDVVFKPGTRNCKVIAGWLVDPYTGRTITLEGVQIDHILPLHRGWNAGAAQWNQHDRIRFANDPLNVIAVSAQANQSKGDSGLDEWLPEPTAQRCPYIERYLAVAVAYQLPITTAERDVATRTCHTGS